MTAEGALPVEWLTPGDRVIARNGMRRLEAVDWRAEADAPVVRIAPRALGSGRPGAALVVAPVQPLWIRDWRAQAIWGRAEVAVPARRLVDGRLICADLLPQAHFLMLHFAQDEVIYAEGVDIACLPLRVTA